MTYNSKEHLVCALNYSELNSIIVALYGYQNFNKRRTKNDPEFQNLLTKMTDAFLLSRDIENAEYRAGYKPDVSKMGVAEAKQFLAYMEQE
jgi:hypothetical protein